MNRQLALAVVAVASLAGCANYSGLDADTKFACKAPDGVTCMSVSGIYANAKASNLPGLRKREDGQATEKISQATEKTDEAGGDRLVQRNYNAPENMVALSGPTEKTSPKSMGAPNFGSPLRTPERILRVWLAPFEDLDNDLHDQKYFYVTVNSGSWTIEANRVNIRSRFQQVYPLSRTNPANKKTDADAQQTPQQAAASVLPVSPVQQPSGSEEQQ